MATELLLHEKIPFAVPEEIGMPRPSQRPPRRHPKETAAWKTSQHTTISGEAPEAPRPASEVPLESEKRQPTFNSEVFPPQV